MKNSISKLKVLSHKRLPDVSVIPIDGDAQVGKQQSVLVTVVPGGTIPLHHHDTDAKMIIASGSGTVLSADKQIDGTEVGPGHCVFFEAFKAHGFKAGENGLGFVSINGGIVDKDGNWDMQFAPA